MNDDLPAIANKIYQSDAYKINVILDSLGVNFYAFNRNYHELRNVLVATGDPKVMLELSDIEKRADLWVVVDEVIRLMHNYLASVKSLVDNTRVLIKKYWPGNKSFPNEYRHEVSVRFANDPLAQFIEALRNEALHHSHLAVVANFSIYFDQATGKQVFKPSMILNKAALNTVASGWNPLARQYLTSMLDNIDISSIVDEYYQKVVEFHKWIRARIRELHSDELAWLEEASSRIETALDKYK